MRASLHHPLPPPGRPDGREPEGGRRRDDRPFGRGRLGTGLSPRWLGPGALVFVAFGVLGSLPVQAESTVGSGPPSASAPTISFRNDVMGVLARAGCNGGTCHGNRNGKGGFKLSLRGQDPDQDHASLTRDQFSRRINLLQPEASLLLLKPTAALAHEGGARFKEGSVEYQILRRWMAEGMPNDLDTAPRLEQLEITPRDAVLVAPVDRVQLRVQGRFSDGDRRDLTTRVIYEAAGRAAQVSPDGLVERQTDGEATILVRHLGRQETMRVAFVPARPAFRWKRVSLHNYIDEQIFAKLRTLRMNPSALCADDVFLRRIFLDLLGRLPTVEEAKGFLADRRGDKRTRWVERLLEEPDFADYWALHWADLLRVEAHSLDAKGVQAFHGWIRQSVANHQPVDQFVRALVTARGSTYTAPAANYYRPHRDPIARAKAAAQVFLGTRLQCAECHNHPSDVWTQDDFYDWAGVFAGVRYKVLENKREISSDEHEWNGEQIVFVTRGGAVKNPRTGKEVQPRFLGEARPVADLPPPAGASAAPDRPTPDPLTTLAAWLTDPDRRWFARVQANRIWFHLMGRGLVDPPDDFRATNPASHPELLESLAVDFVNHRFDLRHLIRRIVTSRAYQLSSEPNDTNAGDTMNYSHTTIRRLPAEPLLDAQSQVTGVPLKFAGYPAGLRAVQLPGVRPESKGKRRASNVDQFLEMFGKPPRLLATDTERSCECNLNQAFQMISGPTVHELLAEPDSRITRLLASGRSNRAIVEEFFWTALSRAPTVAELEQLLPPIESASASSRRTELEDLVWGLLNSKEFLFRR